MLRICPRPRIDIRQGTLLFVGEFGFAESEEALIGFAEVGFTSRRRFSPRPLRSSLSSTTMIKSLHIVLEAAAQRAASRISFTCCVATAH